MNITWQLLNFLRKQDISLPVLLLVFATALHAGIPLPKQGIAQNSGLTAGMGIGTLSSAGCKTLWAWTSNIHYSYDSFIISGASLKFLGGSLDSVNNVINQRYTIDAKIVREQPKYALFIGPAFSFENTDLRTLRKEFSNIGDNEDIKTDTRCGNMYKKIGSSIGFQSGAGFLITPNLGLTFGHDLDLTFKGNFMASFSGSMAYNLRDLFEKLMNNTKNFWLVFEYSALLSESSFNIHNIIFGMALGF